MLQPFLKLSNLQNHCFMQTRNDDSYMNYGVCSLANMLKIIKHEQKNAQNHFPRFFLKENSKTVEQYFSTSKINCPDNVRTVDSVFTWTIVRTLSGQLILTAFEIDFMKNMILLEKTKLNYKIRIPSCEKSEESCFRFLKPLRCILMWFPNFLFKF